MRRGAVLGVAILLTLSACGGGSPAGETSPTPAPLSSGPYTVTAIDYHFHDAHPSRPIRLGEAVRFTNVGQNIHNVTFETVGYSRDLLVGAIEVIDPVSSLFPGPGRYRFHCAYHLDRKMTGVLVIV